MCWIQRKRMTNIDLISICVIWRWWTNDVYESVDIYYYFRYSMPCRFLPRQSSLTIYNTSRLYINLEGCVNTLRGECLKFLQTHGSDGDNNTAQSRFRCFYNKVGVGTESAIEAGLCWWISGKFIKWIVKNIKHLNKYLLFQCGRGGVSKWPELKML